MSNKTVIRCSKCEHCKEVSGSEYATRNNFYCKHPNQDYIREYYKKNRIYRAHGFIDFGRAFEHVPKLKTSPKWCPRKTEK